MLEEDSSDEYRVYMEHPVDENGDTDFDYDEDEENVNDRTVNPDIILHGVLLAPAEVGTRAIKVPQIIGMRGMNIHGEDGITPDCEKHMKKNEEAKSDEMGAASSEDPDSRPTKRGRTSTDNRKNTIPFSGSGIPLVPRGCGKRVRPKLAKKISPDTYSDIWSERDPEKVGTLIPEFKYEENNPNLKHFKTLRIDSPMQFYKEIVPDNYMEQVVDQLQAIC